MSKKPDKPLFDGPVVAETGSDGQRRFSAEQVQNIFQRVAVINFALAGQGVKKQQADNRSKSATNRTEQASERRRKVIDMAKKLGNKNITLKKLVEAVILRLTPKPTANNPYPESELGEESIKKIIRETPEIQYKRRRSRKL